MWEPKYHNGNIEKALQGRNAKDHRSNNDIAFFIGFDADMSNYRNFFEVIIDLCKTFIASVKRVYKSQAAPSTFVYAQSSSTAKMGRVGMKCNPENELPKITNQDKYIQSRMPNWFMAFNPDVKKKEAVKMYNEYLENGVEDKMPDKVVEALNRMWINRNNCNVEYDDDNIYVKFKPKNGTVSYTAPWGFGKYKKHDYLFGRHMHISGVDELRYDLDYRNYIYDYHNKNSIKDLNNLDFIIDYLFDNNLKKLVINVAELRYEDAK